MQNFQNIQNYTGDKIGNNNWSKSYLELLNMQNKLTDIVVWDEQEDKKLLSLVTKIGTKNWNLIALNIGTDKSELNCMQRWNLITKPKTIKGPWSVEEDKKLIEWIKLNGPSNWSACSEFISGRSGKQCRERWMNGLNPTLKKGSWEIEEDYLIFKLFKKFGSKWATIANYLNGRTENSIKNRFYSTLRRFAGEEKKHNTGITTTNNDNTLNLDQLSNSVQESASFKLTLNYLLKYFDMAYKEKTEYFDFLLKNQNLIEQEIFNLQVLKDIRLGTKVNYDVKLQNENNPGNLLKSKRPKSNKLAYHNHNNYSVCININNNNKLTNNLEDSEAEKVRQNLTAKNNHEDVKSPLDFLSKKIESFCQFSKNKDLKQISNGNLGNEVIAKNENINNLNNTLNEEETKTKPDKINQLLTQLNDLENLLNFTKNELFKFEVPKQEIKEENCKDLELKEEPIHHYNTRRVRKFSASNHNDISNNNFNRNFHEFDIFNGNE